MRRAILLIAISVWIPSCTSVRPIQLNPPIAAPPRLAWGYGVERIRNSPGGSGPDNARQGAYLKAVDDLLSRGPVIVSRVVQDSTTVVDARSSRRTMESTFRLRAAGILQPSSIRSGFEDGFAWVLVGTRTEDIERGWKEFLAWRETKIKEAEFLFDHASGPERIGLLEASLAILEETGAADEPGLLYHQVRAALEVEQESLAELESERERMWAGGSLPVNSWRPGSPFSEHATSDWGPRNIAPWTHRLRISALAQIPSCERATHFTIAVSSRKPSSDTRTPRHWISIIPDSTARSRGPRAPIEWPAAGQHARPWESSAGSSANTFAGERKKRGRNGQRKRGGIVKIDPVWAGGRGL